MDLETQLENHEQRISLASVGILMVTMPGGQALEDGQHTVGHIPVGALIDGFQAWIKPTELFGAAVTVSLGVPSNPTLFFDNVVIPDGGAIHNPSTAPVEMFISNEPLIATITTTTNNPEGAVNFSVRYTEVDTKAGKYTH